VKTIVIYSLKGGTGRTAVTCNLGVQLQHQGIKCVLVDADPQNALGLHLGMHVDERFGISRDGLTEHDQLAYRRRNPTKVKHIPFGQCTVEEAIEFEHLCVEDPTWLDQRMARLVHPETEIVLIDAPSGITSWARHAVCAADLVLVTMLPDAVSYAMIPAIERLIEQRGSENGVAYLINQMDSRLGLSYDVNAAMRELIGERLLPFTIPHDESMREAYAQQRPLLEYDPDSQAVVAFRSLAKWVTERLLDE
jgi:cellulose synthase operon protein YhjQ